MPSLFFDTLVIHNNNYDKDSICRTLDLFSACGVQNFIFLIDFDFTKNPISIQKEKINSFKANLADLRKRGMHTYVFNNIAFVKGVSLNKDLPKMYASHKVSSAFLEIDLKSSSDYDILAQDINTLIYTKKVFPLFSHFDSIIEYSPESEYKKLLSNRNFGFGFDLHYIFDPQKTDMILKIIANRTMIMPMISSDISNYISYAKDAEFLIDRIGKSNYSALCHQVQRCSSKFVR